MKRAFLFLGLMGLSCSGQEEALPVQCIPLKTGNYWVYQETDSVGQVDTLDTTIVLRDTVWDGNQGYVVAGYLMGTYDTAVFYYADSFLNALYELDVIGIKMPVDGKLMPEFLQLAQQWHVFQGETTGVYMPPVIDSTDTIGLSIWGAVEDSGARSVPVGDFETVYSLHYTDTIFKNHGVMFVVWQYSWVAPGTGIIQRDDDSSGADPTAQLIEYNIDQ